MKIETSPCQCGFKFKDGTTCRSKNIQELGLWELNPDVADEIVRRWNVVETVADTLRAMCDMTWLADELDPPKELP